MTVYANYAEAVAEIDSIITSKTTSDRVTHTDLAATLKRLAETTLALAPFTLTIDTTDPPTGGSDGDVAWSVTDKIYVRIASVWTLTKTLEFGRYRATHDPTASYLQNDLVYYTNDFYRANKNNGPAAFDLADFDLAFNRPHSIATTGPIGSDPEAPSLAEIQTWYDANVGPALTFDYPQAIQDLITYTTPLGQILQYQRFAAGFTPIYDEPKFITSNTDLTDTTYFYIGGTQAGWQINRYAKTTLVKTIATKANNPTHATLTTAWAARTGLTYA